MKAVWKFSVKESFWISDLDYDLIVLYTKGTEHETFDTSVYTMMLTDQF